MDGTTLFAALFGIFASSFAQPPEVTTSLGVLRGHVLQTLSGKEFDAFEGVPFARPPTGKHRFKQSVPSLPWTGVLNATRLPNMCMQLPLMKDLAPGAGLMPDVIGSEDCLYLNVYTPKLAAQQPSDKLLDVLVQIHGGGYQGGWGHMSGPTFLMDRDDVILVTFNYRLGILGFLSFQDAVVPGNNGLKDQVLALQWVNKHIAAFGGDPNKVTIAGASAGGSSVHSLMFSPLGKGLFQKAISNSGSALNPWVMSSGARKKALVVAEAVGCPTNNTHVTVKCLRERTAEQVVSAVGVLTDNIDYVLFPFSPVIEVPSPTAFMDQHPIDMIKSKAGSDVPAIFSYAIDEGAMFLMKPFFDLETSQQFDDAWDEKIPRTAYYAGLLDPVKEKEVSQAIRNRFLGDAKIADNIGGFSKFMGERYFDDGIQKASLLHAQHQTSPVYSYKFNYDRPNGVTTFFDASMEHLNGYKGGATHIEDTFYVYSSPFANITGSPDALVMKDTMINLWFDFIHDTANWSTVGLKSPQFTYLDVTSSNPKENVVQTEDTVGQQFWDALNIPLDPPAKSASQIPNRTEL